MVPEFALGALLAASCAYNAAALTAMLRRRAEASPKPLASTACRPASVLKPAFAAGEEFAGLLESHAAQDYPEFEILVGARAGDRHAAAAVRRLQAQFPGRRIELVDCPNATPGTNGKVEVVARLARHARYRTLVINDADIRVPSDYLRTVCSELSDPRTGLVTCLYRAEPGTGIGSRLQAMRVNSEFAAQVLLARALQGMRFAMGSTLAMRSETLDEVGGFGPLLRVIGDDYHLGSRIAAKGLEVKVSSLAVSTQLPAGDRWSESWLRELRWSRTIRKQRPLGHAGLAVTFGTVWASLAAATGSIGLVLLGTVCLGLRLATAQVAVTKTGSEVRARDLWLLAASDAWACAAWIVSYFGNSVWWAGRRLRLGPKGRILL